MRSSRTKRPPKTIGILSSSVLLLRKKESVPAAEAFAEFAGLKEGQDIVEEMVAPYSAPEKQTPQRALIQEGETMIMITMKAEEKITS